MRKYATVALCSIALIACQKTETTSPSTSARRGTQPSDVSNAKIKELIQPAPQYIDRAFVGDELGPDGIVKQESETIPAGQPVYLTMVFKESPPGLQARAVWTNHNKETIRTERKDMNGGKVATFAMSDKLKPGRYKVVGYWGGNIAAEREFEITAAPKAKGKKG
jgi:hypothetical protein